MSKREATPAGVDRALNKKLTVEVLKFGAALMDLINAADSGEWHSSTDCKVERRAADCTLCQALTRARKVMKP